MSVCADYVHVHALPYIVIFYTVPNMEAFTSCLILCGNQRIAASAYFWWAIFGNTIAAFMFSRFFLINLIDHTHFDLFLHLVLTPLHHNGKRSIVPHNCTIMHRIQML